jgi:aminoglycoside phosphotransferase (APT) family kinase protein
MHKNEFKIDHNLVYNLLKSQFVELSHLEIKPIISSGTDNALFRLGSEYIVRLPRISSATKNIDKEHEWLPKLIPHLNIPISDPIFEGSPSKDYPWNWLILKWNEGINPEFEQKNEYEFLAKDLANFLNDLHNIKLDNGPISRRGVPLIELNKETIEAIEKLEDELDIPSVRKLWYQLVNIPKCKQDPVWIHGDLLPGNILIKNKRLSSVIDFSDMGMGDPAVDLIIAWSLLNSSARKIFKENLTNIDNDTWERGKGWALSIALIILPYYKDSNPILTSVAKRIIANILSE